MMRVEELMTPHPHTLGPDHDLSDALALMAEKQIRHIPILAQGQLVGLVSHRDALAASRSLLAKGPLPGQQTPLAQVMTRQVAWVSPQAGLKEAGLYLQKHRYGCLPVMDGCKLVGIITDADYVQAALTLMEILEEQSLADA